MKREMDGGFNKPGVQAPRRSARTRIDGEIQLRRSGQHHLHASIYDLSREGCKIEFVERPRLDETVWVKFEGLEALEAIVCWADGYCAGVEFARPIHDAVFAALLNRVSPPEGKKA